MNIALVIERFDEDRGGATRSARIEAEALARKGHAVYVFAGTFEKEREGWSHEEALSIFRIPLYPHRWITYSYVVLWNPRIAKAFQNFLAEVKPDVVHAHNLYPHFPFSLLKTAYLFKGVSRVFFTARDVMSVYYGKFSEVSSPGNTSCPDSFAIRITLWQQIKKAGKAYNPVRNVCIRHYLRYAHKVFAISNPLKQLLTANGIANVAVMSNSIEVSHWQVDSDTVAAFRREWQLEGKQILLFSCGRLSKEKGSHQLLKVLQVLVRDLPNVVLLVAGGGDHHLEKFKNAVSQRKLEDHVVITGFLTGEELHTAYQVSEVILFPSLIFEAFGRIVIEGMASQKPVVATCLGGPIDVITDEENGYVLNPYDRDVFAQRLTTLLSNKKLAEQIGMAGFEHVTNNFTSDQRAEELLSWYHA